MSVVEVASGAECQRRVSGLKRQSSSVPRRHGADEVVLAAARGKFDLEPPCQLLLKRRKDQGRIRVASALARLPDGDGKLLPLPLPVGVPPVWPPIRYFEGKDPTAGVRSASIRVENAAALPLGSRSTRSGGDVGIRLRVIAGGKGPQVSLDQKRARWFGVLYLITFITSIPALVLYEPALRHPVAFIAGSGNVNKIYLGALLELLLIISNLGTAVVIVPIMRRQFEELSIGYVTARIFECTFILVGIVAMLALATLQHENAGAAEGTVAYTLAAIKDWTFLLGPGWVVGWGNGLILGYMMYRTRLVPRPWPWLGLIGGPLLIITGTAILFAGNDPSSGLRSLQGFLTIPEASWELFLGIYCTIWGFRREAPILSENAR